MRSCGRTLAAKRHSAASSLRCSHRGSLQPASAPAAAAPNPGTPGYLQQAYDLSYLSQTRGVGDTIAIVDPFDDPTAESDLAVYRSQYGLPPCTTANQCFTKVNQLGNASPLPARSSTWEQEISLDLDAVSALCPNCHILLVEASSADSADLAKAMSTAASKGANQISASWSIPISNGTLSGVYVFPHVSTVAATGDTGYLSNNTDNFPAAFSKVTAAGGTTLAPTGGARGFSEGAWAFNSQGQGASSGCASPSHEAVVSDRHRMHEARICGPLSRRRPRDRPGLLRLAEPGKPLGSHRGHQSRGSTDRGLLRDHRGRWDYATVGLHRQRAAQRPDERLERHLPLRDPLHLHGRSGLRRPDGGRLHFRCGCRRRAGDRRSPDHVREWDYLHPEHAQSRRHAHRRHLPKRLAHDLVDRVRHQQHLRTADAGRPTSARAPRRSRSPGTCRSLGPNTTYHYRLVAQNSLGTTYGYDYSLTTPQATATDPTAAFSARQRAPHPTHRAAFDARSSTDAGASITDYTWDFGDGTAVTDAGPSATITHTSTPTAAPTTSR